jgi:hypothetical protein
LTAICFVFQAITKDCNAPSVFTGELVFPDIFDAVGHFLRNMRGRRQDAARVCAIREELRGMVLDIEAVSGRQRARSDRRHAAERVEKRAIISWMISLAGTVTRPAARQDCRRRAGNKCCHPARRAFHAARVEDV